MRPRVVCSVLACSFLIVAGGLAYAYATAPYELVSGCTPFTRAVPSSEGLWLLAVFAGAAAVLTAAMAEWGSS